MVNSNDGPSTRSRILSYLRNSPEGISGETMAAALGVSRVAIWKAIQSLNGTGYRITTSATGYILGTDKADSILPWEFGVDEDRFRYWEETDSTMNRAREAALAGARSGTVIMADRQSAGRGTGERRWESASGGLFFTMITAPSFNAAYSHRAILAAQCALSKAARRTAKAQLTPAWPNDMIANTGAGRGKAAGILGETLASGHKIAFLNIGVGINTGLRPESPNAANIEAPRKALLEAFLDEYARISMDTDDMISEWSALCPNAGHAIKFRIVDSDGNPSTTIRTGTFLGPDRSGWARILEDEAQTAESFPPGSITIVDKGNNA